MANGSCTYLMLLTQSLFPTLDNGNRAPMIISIHGWPFKNRLIRSVAHSLCTLCLFSKVSPKREFPITPLSRRGICMQHTQQTAEHQRHVEITQSRAVLSAISMPENFLRVYVRYAPRHFNSIFHTLLLNLSTFQTAMTTMSCTRLRSRSGAT